MNNIFKELPWSTIRVLRYIVHEYNHEHDVDALEIRKHFNFELLREQRHLELLFNKGFIDSLGAFYNGSGIYMFRLTAKSLTFFESFSETLIIFLLSSFAVPAIISVITTVITNSLLKK